MPRNALKPKVGILALTLDLYETLAPGLRQGRERWVWRDLLPALKPSANVLFRKALFRREDVDAAVAEFESQGADALLVLLLTYSPSLIALPALKRTRLPILIWNTQELRAVDETFGAPEMIANHGVHGTQDLANVLLRSGVKFDYTTSHLSDPAALDAVRDFLAAAAAVARLRRARIGMMGYPFPGMGDFAVDTAWMAATLGCETTMLPIEEYILRAEKAPAHAVAALAREYRRSYAVAGNVKKADLDATARVELALRGMIAECGLNALTYQFMAFGEDARMPTVPFVAASRLMAEGIGFGGEGDLIAAAGTTLLNWLAPPATFSEIFTIDFAGNALFMSHMGEANVAMARKDCPTPLRAREAPITRTRRGQLALAVSLEPGPATLFALTVGPGSRWRFVVSPMTILDYPILEKFPSPHFKIAPGGDVRDFLTAYAKAGGPHHNALCFGDARGRLRQAARLLDADYCEV